MSPAAAQICGPCCAPPLLTDIPNAAMQWAKNFAAFREYDTLVVTVRQPALDGKVVDRTRPAVRMRRSGKSFDSSTGATYCCCMALMGQERIAAMFSEFGLATDEDRRKFNELATVGVISVVRDQMIQIECASETPEAAPAAGQDAKLP